MADKKISQLTALTGASLATNDLFPLADVSATETKSITFAEWLLALFAQAYNGTNLIKSSHATAGVGYATGAGGAVAQGTDRTTTVVLNTIAGRITTMDTSLAALAIVTFTVTNSAVAATDVIVLSKVSGDVDTFCWVNSVAAGSFTITLRNSAAVGADVTAFVLNFAVIKSVIT